MIFLDEAYALTTWEAERDGTRTLSAYSGEAISELVAFLSQRAGSVSFIAAGYEKEMLGDFITANDGLSRRFPLRVWLQDYKADELVSIYLHSLAAALNPPPPGRPLTSAVVESYFTSPALQFLAEIVQGSREGSGAGLLRYPLLHTLFAPQAAAMVSIANATAILVAANRNFVRIGLSGSGTDTWALGFQDVYDILRTVAQQRFGPGAAQCIQELNAIAQVTGWMTRSGIWQVPQTDARDESTRRRSGGRRAR